MICPGRIPENETLTRLLKRKSLAMQIERRPGSYWLTMRNATRNIFGDWKYHLPLTNADVEKF